MSAPNELERLELRALKDNATPERVERIWRRLELELPSDAPRSRRAVRVPIPALVVFGVGLLALGFVLGRMPNSAPIASVSPEPPHPFVPAQRRAARAAPPTPATPAQRRLSTPVSRSASTAVPEAVEDIVAAPAVVPASSASVRVSQWQELFERGQNEAAWDALERAGGFESVLQGASADELSTLYYLASAVRDQGRAIVALKTIIDRFPGTGDAEDATWSLAQKLDEKGDLTGAARAYADYEQNFPQGDMVEDALFNQVVIADKQGNRAQVIQFASQYAQQFPNGRDLPKVLRMRARAEAGQGAAETGAGGEPSVSPSDESDEVAPADPAATARH